MKPIVILSGAMGWWEKVFTTHSPLGDIKNLPIFQHHVNALERYKGTLVSDVIVMEKLAPARPGGSYELEVQKNPEYPFLSYHVSLTASSGEFRLDKPSTHFGEADSRRYYNTAQELLTAVLTLYPQVTSWELVIPAPF